MKLLPVSTGRRWSCAFSLVEVTLAVAVTATVALALLGLLPAGMDGMRQSAITAAHARILQTVSGNCQMTDWGQLTSPDFQSKTYTFDYHGGELEEPPGGLNVSYQARAEVKPAPALPGGTVANPRMRMVLIKIANGNRADTFETGRPVVYATQIAQMSDTP